MQMQCFYDFNTDVKMNLMMPQLFPNLFCGFIYLMMVVMFGIELTT